MSPDIHRAATTVLMVQELDGINGQLTVVVEFLRSFRMSGQPKKGACAGLLPISVASSQNAVALVPATSNFP
jgi:hypothetical protein